MLCMGRWTWWDCVLLVLLLFGLIGLYPVCTLFTSYYNHGENSKFGGVVFSCSLC